MECRLYSHFYKSKYKNVSIFNLVEALKTIFPKLGLEMSYDEFYKKHGGFNAFGIYPENISMFDVLVNTLVNEYAIKESDIERLFDLYFKEQDERFLENLNKMIANYLPYLQKDSLIQQTARTELPNVKSEYYRRLDKAFDNLDIRMILSVGFAMIKDNCTRIDYHNIIPKYFKKEVIDLTAYLNRKNYNNAQAIAEEILMLILVEDFNYPKPIS